MRYAWAHNPEPKNRVYLRLHVDVGSLAETETEQGMAHFLEHLAFNGSEQFPAGTLIEWFQSNGMSFGADTNASTSFSETIYKLDLPGGDEETLREGLAVLKDFGFGLLLEEDEVQAEKGVIDGEERERDSAQFRMMLKQMETVFAGTRYMERIPIGIKDVRDQFTAESVRAFYEKWYRPDNMTLILVGDLGELNPEPLFAEAFGEIPASSLPPVVEPALGKPLHDAFAFSVYESEIPTVTLSLERLSPYVEEPITIKSWVKNLPLSMAYGMLNTRFGEMAKEEDTPFLAAQGASTEVFTFFDSDSLTITCSPERWKDALAAAEQELRRALEFGFSQSELDEIRANTMLGLSEGVEREATAHSTGLLNGLVLAAEQDAIPTRAAFRLAAMGPVIEAMTVEACQRALVKAWSRGKESVTAMGGLDLGDDAGPLLFAALAESRELEVTPRESLEAQDFAYASDPSHAGGIAKQHHIEDLDVHQVQFENGVTLNIKKTDFKERQIQVSAEVGEGALTLAPEKASLNMLAGQTVIAGGLEAHSSEELRRILAGKQAGVNFGIGEDRFLFSGATTQEDLLLQFEMMCATMTQLGWRPDGLIPLQRAVPQFFEGLKHQPSGPVSEHFLPAIFSNDPRRSLPDQELLLAATMNDVKEWLEPAMNHAPIEVTVVGDLHIETVIEYAKQTLGTLSQRREVIVVPEMLLFPKPKGGILQTHSVATQVPKSLVLIAYPATDGLDTQRSMELSMLTTVLDDRLRLEVRERLGAAYSPSADSMISSVFPGDGIILVQAMSDPDKTDTLVEACLATAQELATNGVTQEEVVRLKEPILNGLRDAQRTNGFWLSTLGEAHRNPQSLDDLRSLESRWNDLTAEQLTKWAQKFFAKETANVCIVHPEME